MKNLFLFTCIVLLLFVHCTAQDITLHIRDITGYSTQKVLSRETTILELKKKFNPSQPETINFAAGGIILKSPRTIAYYLKYYPQAVKHEGTLSKVKRLKSQSSFVISIQDSQGNTIKVTGMQKTDTLETLRQEYWNLRDWNGFDNPAPVEKIKLMLSKDGEPLDMNNRLVELRITDKSTLYAHIPEQALEEVSDLVPHKEDISEKNGSEKEKDKPTHQEQPKEEFSNDQSETDQSGENNNNHISTALKQFGLGSIGVIAICSILYKIRQISTKKNSELNKK